MDTSELREKLKRKIDVVDKIKLEKVETLLTDDFEANKVEPGQLPKNVQKRLEQSIAEADAGKTISHAEVKRRIHEKYPFLKK